MSVHSDNFFRNIMLVFALLLVVSLVKIILQGRKSRLAALAELERPYDLPPLREINVRVLSKEWDAKVYGVKYPEMRKEFFVTFLTSEGKSLRYPVEEDVYALLKEGQTGTIAVINERLYGFVPDGEGVLAIRTK